MELENSVSPIQKKIKYLNELMKRERVEYEDQIREDVKSIIFDVISYDREIPLEDPDTRFNELVNTIVNVLDKRFSDYKQSVLEDYYKDLFSECLDGLQENKKR